MCRRRARCTPSATCRTRSCPSSRPARRAGTRTSSPARGGERERRRRRARRARWTAGDRRARVALEAGDDKPRVDAAGVLRHGSRGHNLPVGLKRHVDSHADLVADLGAGGERRVERAVAAVAGEHDPARPLRKERVLAARADDDDLAVRLDRHLRRAFARRPMGAEVRGLRAVGPERAVGRPVLVQARERDVPGVVPSEDLPRRAANRDDPAVGLNPQCGDPDSDAVGHSGVARERVVERSVGSVAKDGAVNEGDDDLAVALERDVGHGVVVAQVGRHPPIAGERAVQGAIRPVAGERDV